MLPVINNATDIYDGDSVPVTYIKVTDDEATLRLKDGKIRDGVYSAEIVARANLPKTITISIGNRSAEYPIDSTYGIISKDFGPVVSLNNPCLELIFPTGEYWIYALNLSTRGSIEGIHEQIEIIDEVSKEAFNSASDAISRLESLEPIVESHSANFDVMQDSIMSDVAANYTRADEFNTYVVNQNSSITQLSDSVTAQFEETKSLVSNVDGSLETYKEDISKYIRFSAEGIEIGEEGNALTLKIDNDEIGFYKEGTQIAYWDGSTLYTGNAWITLEQQFRIGNFAAIPRSDGSVSWLKVGE